MTAIVHLTQGVYQRARRFPTLIWLLGFGCLVNISGLSLLWPVNAIYIHTELGKSVTVAGLVLMVYSGAGFLGSVIGGWLYDRIGAIAVLLFSLAASGCVILVPVFWSGWAVYVAVMVVFGIASAVPFPVLNAMAGRAWPSGGRRAFNFLYVCNNLGVAIGTALGGVLAEWSFHSVFIGIAVAYTVFLLIVAIILRPLLNALAPADKPLVPRHEQRTMGAKHKQRAEQHVAMAVKAATPPVPWIPIFGILLGFALSWAVYVQWQSTISVYMQALHYPLSSYSVLWTWNGILIFALQPFVAYVTRRVPALHIQMMVGVCFYAVAFSLLSLAHSYVAFFVAMTITTLGEVFVWPSVPAAIAVHAPNGRVGLMQGMVQSAATLGRMLGPLAGGWLYDQLGMPTMMYFLIPILIIPVLCFSVFGAHPSSHHAHVL